MSISRLSRWFGLFILILIHQWHTLQSDVATPWYMKTHALSPILVFDDQIIVDVTGNASHVYVLDSYFDIHLFKLIGVSDDVEYVKTMNIIYSTGAYASEWSDGRENVDVKIAINPYNRQVYMIKYIIKVAPAMIQMYRFDSNNFTRPLGFRSNKNLPYFATAYANPRLKIEFDSTSVYICQYNDAQRSPKAGYLIAKMTPTFVPIANITSTNDGVLSISFYCHQSPIICVWTTSQSVTEYWMSNLTVYRTYTLNESPIALNFNPKIVEAPNGIFSYYLHHNTALNTTVLLHRKNASHVSLPGQAVQLPYAMLLPPPEAYDLVMSNDGDIIVGMTAAPGPSNGLGERDVAVFKYSSTLQLKSQFLFSTMLIDHLTKLFLPKNDGNTIVIAGFTDGHPDSTLDNNRARRVFVAQFEFFEITNISTKFQGYVLPEERVNISYSSIPPTATSAIPIVQIGQEPCQNVLWMGSSLSAKIPPGAGGPFAFRVYFNYLPHSPSVIGQNFTYFPTPVILDVQPKQGPAAGYIITLTAGDVIPHDNSAIIFIGGNVCANVQHVNASVVTCRTPPGTGRNASVVLSIMGLLNSTETFHISYDPPQISQINPIVIPTSGAPLWIKGSNFGPCFSIPCNFANISIIVENFGSCTNGKHWNDTDLQCNAPEGFDANRSVSITVDGQSGASSAISYGKPSISGISPAGSISRNPTVIIEGNNFGLLAAPRSVIFQDDATLRNYTCPDVTWISHKNIRCQFTTADLPLTATLNVVVIIGTQYNDWSEKSVFKTGITNNPPVASPLSVGINEAQSIILQFQASDPDADDSVTIYIVASPKNGTLYQVSTTGERGNLIDTDSGSIAVTNTMFRVLYSPRQDFNGTDSFDFVARDIWNAESSIEVAEITVTAVPDPPVPKTQIYQLDEDDELTFSLEATDPDSFASEITVIVLSLPTNGVLYSLTVSNTTSWTHIAILPAEFTQNTTFKYSPFPNKYGTDSFAFMANDGYLKSAVNGTISFNVRPVNDPPILNVTGLNLAINEDTEALFTFDIYDVDEDDKITVKITNLAIDGAIYFLDLQKGTRVLLGEGSEVIGPPYQLLYVPPLNYYTRANQSLQSFNITYADGSTSGPFSHRVAFPVLGVNDAPVISCSQPQVELPVKFLIGASSNFTFFLQASDVDDPDLTFTLSSAPVQGALRTADGLRLVAGSSFHDMQLTFDAERSGGGYPYSNFTVYAVDTNNARSNDCTFYFTFTCPPGLYNNIFSKETGELCTTCPQGAICSTDGKIAPIPQLGWWRSAIDNTFLECSPMEACLGKAENICGTGYKGVRCADCQQGYYRLGAVCRECRTMNILPTILALIICGTIAILLYYLQRMRIYRLGFALINILINFLQTIWILRKMRLDWPQELLMIIDSFSILHFNVEFVAPECIIQSSLNFSQKLRIVLALPIVLLTIALSATLTLKLVETGKMYIVTQSQKSNVHGKKTPLMRRTFGLSMMELFNASLSIMYVHLASKSLSLFDCTLEDDGNAYLDEEMSLVCYTDWWYQDLPIGVAAILIYVIGIPVYFGILCFLYYQTKFRGGLWDKWKIIASQFLHGDGDFKPEYQHFVIIQLFQKLIIVAISIFFSRYTGLQVVLTIVSLLMSYMTYNKYNPYIHQTLNTLEKLSVICSILVLAFGLPFRVDAFGIAQYRTGLVVIILSVIFGFILTVFGVVVRDVRESISRKATLKRQSKIKHLEI